VYVNRSAKLKGASKLLTAFCNTCRYCYTMSVNQIKKKEISNYPKDPNIKWEENRRSFFYNIIKEGFYPKKPILQRTLAPASHPIPNDYIVQTTWGRSTNKCTVQCSIIYTDNKPVYQVAFGNNFSEQVVSYKSPSNAAVLLHKVSIQYYYTVY